MAGTSTAEAAGDWRMSQITKPQLHGLFAAWLGFALDGFDFYLMVYVLSDVAKEFQLSLPVAASLVGAAFTSRWLAGPVIGTIADRYGRRTAMMVAIWCYSLGTAACGLAWSFSSMFLFRAIVGIGMAGEYSSSAAYVIEIFPPSARNKASSLLYTGFPLGGIAAAQVYPLLIGSLGWRGLFFLGLAPVLATLYVRFFAPESGPWEASRAEDKENKISAIQILSPPRLIVTLLLCVTAFAFFFGAWPILGLLPTYLKNTGYAPTEVSTIMSVGGAGAIVGAICSGIIADRLGTARTIAISLLCAILIVVPMLSLGKTSIALIAVFAFANQMTQIGLGGIVPKWVAEHFPITMRGAGVGLVYNVGAFGGFFGPTLAGGIAAAFGLGPALLIVVVCMTSVTLLSIGLDLPRRLTSTRETPAFEPA